MLNNSRKLLLINQRNRNNFKLNTETSRDKLEIQDKFKIQEKGIFIGCNHIIKNDYIRSNLKYYFFGHGYIYHNNDNDKLYGNHKKEVNNLEYDIEKFAMVSRNNDLNVHRFTQETINELYNINATSYLAFHPAFHRP